MRYLLTPSLYDNWRFYRLLESKEKQDFLDTLLKKEVEKTPQMMAGIKFENDILKISKGRSDFVESVKEIEGDDAYLKCVTEVAATVREGLWQERVMFDAHLSGTDFLIYGKMDVVKRDWIYDIKRTENYEVGKYTESVQHPVYMKGSGINKFRYIISDGESVWHEDYAMTDGMEAAMWSSLRDLVDGIMDDDDFRRAYQEKWQAFGAAKKQVIPNDGVGRIIMGG